MAENAKAQAQTTEQPKDISFLQAHEGEGLDTFTQADVATGYLQICQPDSKYAQGGIATGHWFSSITGKDWGTEIKVSVLAYANLWHEKDRASGKTVGRYMPGGLEVQTTTNVNGYPVMTNPKTGNVVYEIGTYVLLVHGYENDGPLVFTPSLTSIPACKNWNRQVMTKTVGNVKLPLFGGVWKLTAGVTKNPQNPAKDMGILESVVYADTVTEDFMNKHVMPELANTKALLSSSTTLLES